uniref:WGS project CBMI000000000 data, contig CS3069_c002285 n=1 Tax=Fusarium clavum TaxID=2594811 RepID=A0A090MCK9_9HYPO|nr:unnamed protein product [Fusarium clavum]
MHDNDPTEDLGLTCPSGTDFYVCKNDPERFIGCCAINPCGVRKGLCPDQYLKPATFDKAYEEYISPQACINDNVDVAWHVCSWSTSSFMGCCAVDPCNGGCPARQLRAAKLSDNTKNAECFLGEDYEYEPKPSYTSSGSLDPTTSTSVSSTTAVSTTASSFTTSFLTSSTSGTIMTSNPKHTSAPPKGGGGSELELLWLLLLLLPFLVAIYVLRCIIKSKSHKAHEDSVAETDASIKKNAETKKAFPSDKGADKRTAEPINNYSICPSSQFAGLPPPPVNKKAAPSTNRHDIQTKNGQVTVPSPPTEKEAPTTRRDFQTEDGQIAVKSEISQTHSAELTQSQINLSINLSTPSPGSSRAFQQDSPFPPPQRGPSHQRLDNGPIEARHDSDANTPVTTNITNPQLNDHQSVELEATPVSREPPKVPAELDGTSTQIPLSKLPDFRQRAVSQPDLEGKALVVPGNTLSEARRRATMTLLDSTTQHVKAKDGRVVNDKNTPQTNPLINMRDSRPRLPRQDLADPPQQPSHQPVNKDISTTHPSRDNVPVSINPQVCGPDTENEDSRSSELESTGPRKLGVTNPDLREESPGASAVPKIIRVPGRGRTQKRQRPQIPRKPLSPLSEESVGWENGSR